MKTNANDNKEISNETTIKKMPDKVEETKKSNQNRQSEADRHYNEDVNRRNPLRRYQNL